MTVSTAGVVAGTPPENLAGEFEIAWKVQDQPGFVSSSILDR
jgi:hypothetical protein